MRDLKIVEQLSVCSEGRTLQLLQNGQVELCWDRIVLRMRKIDLMVLDKTLQEWMAGPDFDWAQAYSLWLGDTVIFLGWSDLHRFCAMVQDAGERLPQRPVRWTDLKVAILPVDKAGQQRTGRLSPN